MDIDWLKKLAPTVAALWSGPFAGLAVEAVSAALGVGGDEARQLVQDGKLSGEQLGQIRQAEIAMRARAQEMGLDLERLAVQDRQSARDMQRAVGSRLVPTLAVLVVVSFIVVAVIVLTGRVSVETVLAGTLIGYLSAKCDQVLAYYFGSSASSGRKDELLWRSTPAGVGQAGAPGAAPAGKPASAA